ncbi:Midasin, partial [Dictyocoela roeselum]
NDDFNNDDNIYKNKATFNNTLPKKGLPSMIDFKKVTLRKIELLNEFLKLNPGKLFDAVEIANLEKTKRIIQCDLIQRKISKDKIKRIGHVFVQNDNSKRIKRELHENIDIFGIHPYYLPYNKNNEFKFNTPTTLQNLYRILRAMSMKRGIILSGEPGIGKTSIVEALADRCGKNTIRINLSEQTEFSDLSGSYIPIVYDTKNHFANENVVGDNTAGNGAEMDVTTGNNNSSINETQEVSIKFIKSQFIRGIENGSWIILDEINLCTQSVIEGLNSIFDFRGEILIENQLIKVHPDTVIFATLNPWNTQNGRKILPRSFTNRFIEM